MSLSTSLQNAAHSGSNENYDPREDQGEYMNPRMQAYFYCLLKERLKETIHDIEQNGQTFRDKQQLSDLGDQANAVMDENLAKNRIQSLTKVRNKIQDTLYKIDNDKSFQYGFDKQGEEIGIGRLMLIPWATTSADDKDLQSRKTARFNARANTLG